MSTTQTRWVNIRACPHHDVYCGRPRAGEAWRFGNPFQVGRDGVRGECVGKFETWLQTGDQQGCPDATEARRGWILDHVHELKGRVLGCFCAPADCHCRILAARADQAVRPGEVRRMVVRFWTDGACKGNPGPMGAGIVASFQRGAEEVEREWSIPLGHGTNQQAELRACIEALSKLREPGKTHVVLYTDSAYVVGFVQPGSTWQPKANHRLVAELRALVAGCAKFEVFKVAGHAEEERNNRADVLASQAATQPFMQGNLFTQEENDGE